MLKKNLAFFLLSLATSFTFSFSANASPINNLFHQSGDPSAGNPNGKVTVVEFFDYQCSHCSNMAPVISAIIKANPDVRIIFKDFPIRGPASEYAALAAIAASKQGRYYPFNHALLSTPLTISESNVLEIAKSVNVNISKLEKDMKSSAVKTILDSNYTLARELNVNGTPAFFIGKTNAQDLKQVEEVMGEMSQRELQDAINKAKS